MTHSFVPLSYSRCAKRAGATGRVVPLTGPRAILALAVSAFDPCSATLACAAAALAVVPQSRYEERSFFPTSDQT